MRSFILVKLVIVTVALPLSKVGWVPVAFCSGVHVSPL